MNDAIDKLIAERGAEKERLGRVVDNFAALMKERLYQKVDEGYTGWDSADDWIPIVRIEQEVRDIRASNNVAAILRKLVDLAAYAMFLRYIMMTGAESGDD